MDHYLCQAVLSKPTPIKLTVLTRSGTNSPVQFTEVGELKNGQITVSAVDGSPALVEGRPIYEQKPH